jgi:Fe-S cluster assembly iron-binding protein IscA
MEKEGQLLPRTRVDVHSGGCLGVSVGQSFSEPVADDDELGAGNLNLEISKRFQARRDKEHGRVAWCCLF